ncbi:hypothetical protein [Burkholderia ubonensis]|uniref:hypothetical protein n=1 Tax=Burkholderia ubonensis TaxID=101571 RepID=UPI0018DFF9BD|nr:hypothetical protein [Burkholderia ubonensis]
MVRRLASVFSLVPASAAVDGGHCEVRGSSSLIAIVKQYFGGQGGDALLLSGSDIKVGTHYGIMRNDGVSQGSAVLRISGNYNQIGTSQVLGTLNRFDGVIITGVGNTINDLIARECRTVLTVTGSQNRVRGLLGPQRQRIPLPAADRRLRRL